MSALVPRSATALQIAPAFITNPARFFARRGRFQQSKNRGWQQIFAFSTKPLADNKNKNSYLLPQRLRNVMQEQPPSPTSPPSAPPAQPVPPPEGFPAKCGGWQRVRGTSLRLRHEIRFGADTAWSPRNGENRSLRREFLTPAGKAFTGEE